MPSNVRRMGRIATSYKYKEDSSKSEGNEDSGEDDKVDC